MSRDATNLKIFSTKQLDAYNKPKWGHKSGLLKVYNGRSKSASFYVAGRSYRAPAKRSTESVSDEECCRDRLGVFPEKENFLDRRVSESDPDDDAGEYEAYRIGDNRPAFECPTVTRVSQYGTIWFRFYSPFSRSCPAGTKEKHSPIVEVIW